MESTTPSQTERSIFDFDDEEAPQGASVSDVYRGRIRAALEGNAERVCKAEKSKGTGAKRFSTDYAVAWGRAQGWRLIDRERFDFRTMRHMDCLLASDAMFSSEDGLVLVQGAGRGQRAKHERRFLDRGGHAELARLRARFYYLEFKRGSREPAKMEVWS